MPAMPGSATGFHWPGAHAHRTANRRATYLFIIASPSKLAKRQKVARTRPHPSTLGTYNELG
jgi:hypothetical protein